MSSHTWEAAEIRILHSPCHGKLDSQYSQIARVLRYNCGYLSRQNIRLSLLKLKSWPQTASARSRRSWLYPECKCVPLSPASSIPLPVLAVLAEQVDGAVRCTRRRRHLWGTSSGPEQKSCRDPFVCIKCLWTFSVVSPFLPLPCRQTSYARWNKHEKTGW